MPTFEDVRRQIEDALGVSQVDWWLDEAVRVILAHRAFTHRRKIHDVSTVGARIRTAREVVGLTQHQLAARLGPSVRQGARKAVVGWDVSSWEREKRDLPGEHLQGLCFALGVSQAWLLDGGDEGGPPLPGGILRKQKLVNWSHASQRQKRRAEARADLERLRGLRAPKKSHQLAGGE